MNKIGYFLLIACVFHLGASGPVLNPRVAFTVPISDAGPMVFDGTYLWVASSNFVTAIDPATGTIAGSQQILGTRFMAYDPPTGTLWLSGGSQSAQLNRVNAQRIITDHGTASVNSIAFSSGLPNALALDSSLSGRNVWAVAGGIATLISMGPFEVVRTIRTPDGFPITQINAAPGLDGMLVSTSGLAPGGQPAANVWFYGSDTARVRLVPYDQVRLSPGAWDVSALTQYWGEIGTGALYKYTFSRAGGKATVARYTLHLTDAADNEAQAVGGITGVAVTASEGLILVVRQEVDLPNQVYFVPVRDGQGTYEVPGLTVPGAALTIFGGGFAWASSPGPAGGVTAMTY
jgi:hypothetical protein